MTALPILGGRFRCSNRGLRSGISQSNNAEAGLPWNNLPVPPEQSGFVLRRISRQPYYPVGSFFD